ncbi:MAG: class I adenylate-forming enzyme family protein [Rhodococcus sp. (in: high G+C Gram-positive bacteria)]
MTYAGLRDASEAVAQWFARQGVKSGDRTVVLGGNWLGWVLAYLAGLRLGAIVSPANNRLNPSQFAEQWALLDARLVAYDATHEELAKASGRPLARLEDLEELAPGPAPMRIPWPEPDMDALISFTSGTTGVPKGAVLTHAALLGASRGIVARVSLRCGDSTLVLVPLLHNTGFVDHWARCSSLGAVLICCGGSAQPTRSTNSVVGPSRI